MIQSLLKSTNDFQYLNQNLWPVLLNIFLYLYFKIDSPNHPRKYNPRCPKTAENVKTGSDWSDSWSTTCKGQPHFSFKHTHHQNRDTVEDRQQVANLDPVLESSFACCWTHLLSGCVLTLLSVWGRSRPGCNGLWAAWSNGRCPWPWQVGCHWMIFQGLLQPKSFSDSVIKDHQCSFLLEFRHWFITIHVPKDWLHSLWQGMKPVVSPLLLGEPVSMQNGVICATVQVSGCSTNMQCCPLQIKSHPTWSKAWKPIGKSL